MNKQEVYNKIEEHFRENYDRLVKVNIGFAGNYSDAEDIIQGAYVRACEYWESYQPDMGTFSGWMDAIINNMRRDALNERKSHGMNYKADISTPPEDYHISRDELNNVLNEIEKEKPETKYILYMFLILGYTAEEISKVVPYTKNNIYQTISYWRNKRKNTNESSVL